MNEEKGVNLPWVNISVVRDYPSSDQAKVRKST
jgi:hypothetical protein